jgi:predicted nucleic acid-binding Zn ribbon protein
MSKYMINLDNALMRRVFSKEENNWLQPCLYCEHTFLINKQKRYCSEECRNKARDYRRRKPKDEKTCLACGSTFLNGRTDKKYCSEKCGNRFRGFKWDNNNKEKLKELRKAYRLESWPRFSIPRLKFRAKEKNIDFDLVPSDLDVPEFCSVLKIKLNYQNVGTGYHPDSPSVDRIDPKKGYVKGNVRVISSRANLLKNDATIEELQLVLADLENLNTNKNEVHP